MHLNTTPPPTPSIPCMRDYSRLISPNGLLPEAVVPLLPMKQLKRRIREINATHPQYQEETPLVLKLERARRKRLSGQLQVAVNHAQVA
jgi:hypothetical protein